MVDRNMGFVFFQFLLFFDFADMVIIIIIKINNQQSDLVKKLNEKNDSSKNAGIFFRLCPAQYVIRPQLQSTGHYLLNHYVKVWHVRLGGGNNTPTKLGPQGTNGKKTQSVFGVRAAYLVLSPRTKKTCNNTIVD